MKSLVDIIKQNKKAQFERQCDVEAFIRFGKRYQDCSDKECARISKDVKNKILL